MALGGGGVEQQSGGRAHRLRYPQPAAALGTVVTRHSHPFHPKPSAIIAHARHTVKWPRGAEALASA